MPDCSSLETSWYYSSWGGSYTALVQNWFALRSLYLCCYFYLKKIFRLCLSVHSKYKAIWQQYSWEVFSSLNYPSQDVCHKASGASFCWQGPSSVCSYGVDTSGYSGSQPCLDPSFALNSDLSYDHGWVVFCLSGWKEYFQIGGQDKNGFPCRAHMQ